MTGKYYILQWDPSTSIHKNQKHSVLLTEAWMDKNFAPWAYDYTSFIWKIKPKN